MSTFTKFVYCCKVKRSLPKERENPQKFYSVSKCMKDPVISHLCCCSRPRLGCSMNESFVGICLMQTEPLGKPHIAESVSQPARRLPRV